MDRDAPRYSAAAPGEEPRDRSEPKPDSTFGRTPAQACGITDSAVIFMRLRLPWHWFRKRAPAAQSHPALVAPEVRKPEKADDAAVRGTELLEANRVETLELGELAKLPPFRP